MLITEGLAELKVLDKRIEKSRTFVVANLARQNYVKDPLESEGGSVEVLRRELQSIADLEARKVAIRTAIQRTNLATPLTVKGDTRTVGEWLTWRREVAAGRAAFLGGVTNAINSIRQQARAKGLNVTVNGVEAQRDDLVLNTSEVEWHTQSQTHEELVGTLDGALSVINATTTMQGL